MKLDKLSKRGGSILVITVLTISILTALCATGLYVLSQNANAGMQTASWQQSLTGAESGIDMAIRALNVSGTDATAAWTAWRSVSLPTGTLLPSTEPTGSVNAPVPTGPPDAAHYNYLPSTGSNATVTLGDTEGANQVASWVTIDQGGMLASQDTNGKQWYRIRSTGVTSVSGPGRTSANKLDNSLRNTISLIRNRKGGAPGVSRTVEVILQPLAQGGWVRGITLSNKFTISGSGIIDSYNSSQPGVYSTAGGQWVYNPDPTIIPNHLAHGDTATGNSTGASLSGGAHLYGSLAFSGPAVSGAVTPTTVSGSITTPFTPPHLTTYDPVTKPGNSGYSWTNTLPSANNDWGPGVATLYASGPKDPANGNAVVTTVTANGTAANPTLYVVNGDFTVSGGGVFTVDTTSSDVSNPKYVTIWVKGKLTTSGSGVIKQKPGSRVVWIVDGDITASGSSYNNQSGFPSNTTFVQVSGDYNASTGLWEHQGKVTCSGSADFIGQIVAPGALVTVSGGGSLCGALLANTLTVSGGSGLHYDEALGGGGGASIGNYAFAGWFEDNSHPTRGITY